MTSREDLKTAAMNALVRLPISPIRTLLQRIVSEWAEGAETDPRADTWAMTLAACALGFAIPALIYVLMRVGVALWLDSQR